MATILSIGDIAIVQFNSSISTGSADTFSFVFLRGVEAGTTISFTDNGWLAAGGFRPGEGTVTYTAPSAIASGTIVTLTGLDLAVIGDQIIAYQGDAASPTILHLVDFADGNNTVAGDATSAQTTALPPGFALGVNAAAIAFDQAIYAGPTSGSPAELFAAGNNAANWIDSNELPQPFRFNDRPDIDLDDDNSTHGGRDYETIVASGGPGVQVADFDITIGDDDDDDLFAAEIKVNGRDPEDLLTVVGPLPPGITATAYDPDTGILRLNGHGSHLDYQQAILQVRFSTTDAPNNLKRIEVIVFDGDEWSSEGDAFIRVQTNLTVAAPGLDLDANNSNGGGADYTATYTAGGPGTPIADVDVTITDADSSTLVSATITIQNWNQPAGDTLSIAGSLPFGITASAYDPVNLTITLSGTASLDDYETALRRVVFSSTNPAPGTGDRGIQVVVNDGGVSSNIATTYMHVAAATNVAPALNLDANSSTTGGVDFLTTFTGGGPAVVIVDTDVLITDGDDANLVSATIRLTNAAAGDTLVFNGAAPAGIVASAYDPATGILTLTGTAPLASYQTALQQITFNNSGTPAAETRVIEITVNDEAVASNVAHAIIEIDPGNLSAPDIDLDGNDSTAPGTTFRTTFTENGAAVPIADTDTLITDADSSNLASATITLTNAQPGDLLSISGTLPAGIAASAYDPATGILTLTTISGPRTLADYQTALTQIRFSAAGDNPATDDRVVQVVVNDGANDGDPATALVTVAAVDDAPTLSVAESATYTEKSAPLMLSPAVTLADIDDTDLSLAFVRIADGTFVGSDMLTIGGATSGSIGGITFQWVEAVQTLVINGAGSIAAYQALLQRVEFQSTSDNPTDFNARPTRTIDWTVSDGSNTATATTQLDIVAVNDAPIASVAATATYTENGPPLVISPAATANDVDDINLVAGQVRIVTPLGGDILTVNGLQSGTFAGLDFAYDPTAGRLMFGHPATVADFQTFMQAVEFSSTSDDPTAGGAIPTRTLSWALFDGDGISDLQTTVLTITAANDAPVAQDGSASGSEDTPVNGTLVATDVDEPTLTYALGTQAAHGTVVVNPDGSFTYTPNADFNGTDSFTFLANDGTADSNAATINLTINPVNDAPVNTVPGAQTANEDTALSIAGLSVADVDSPTLTTTLTVTNGTLAIVAGAARVTGFLTNILTINGTIAEVNAALGSVSYLGNPNFTGSDSLTVTTDDGTTAPDVDTVAITVAAVADAPELDLDPDNSSGAPGSGYITVFTENGAPALLADADISLTDADDENLVGATFRLINNQPGDTLVVIGTLPPAITSSLVGNELTLSGTASIAAYMAALGQIAFNNPGEAPDPENRLILVSVDDGSASTNAFVIVQVQPVNDPPVAQDGSASGTEDTPLGGTLVATDVDSEGLTYALGTQAAHGTAVVNADGSFTYTPNADFNGTDSFTFLANDDAADSNIAIVNLTIAAVNDAPAAQDGSAGGTEDSPVNGTLVATDVDSATLTYALGTPAAHGTVVVNADGSFTYTPNQDFNGADSFTFLANDGAANSNTATVNLTIAAVNDAPLLDLDADDSSVPSTHFATVFSGAPVPISDPDVAIADPDSAMLASATIDLLILSPGDLLSVNGPLPAGISASAYDPVTGILTLSGEASLADYQLAIHQVEFGTSSAVSSSRMIEVKVNDGALDSNAAVSVIDFAAPPEPPEPPPITGDPHWMATRQFLPHPAGWSPIIVADFAGDQMSDLLWRSDSTGNLDEWQIANGGWTRSVDLGGHASAGFLPAAAGDFDGDGTEDVFWFEPASGNTDIWIMANGEHAASISPGPHPAGFDVAGTGDFDGDGTDDVLWFSAQTGEADIWKIAHGQWAGSVNPGASPAGFAIAAIGDTNHDGSDDVIWFNSSSGEVQIWEMQNGQLAQTIVVGPHPAGYGIVGSADFTGDGTDDILWFNPATNHVDLWKMQDSHWAGSVDIGPHPPGWQPIGLGDSDGNGIADVWWQQGATSTVETWMLSVQ